MVEALRVFVYGTLMPGEVNYPAYCEPWVVSAQAAIVLGTLYDLPLGYPAFASGSAPVYGYLLTFASSNVLLRLDELESYDPHQPAEANEYSRCLVEVLDLNHQPMGEAWVYQMRLEHIQALGGVQIPEGQWLSPVRRSIEP